MHEPQVADLLDRLRSAAPRDAWTLFLERYSALILEVVRLFERQEDAVSDCYLFVCEQLGRRRFARLLRYRPDGPARFSTWLCAVVRNLCLDWHRKEVGRHRVFASIARMSPLDQRAFHCLFVELLPAEDAYLELRPAFPGLTFAQVTQSAERIERALTSRQRWLLAVRGARAAPATVVADEAAGHAPWDVSPAPDPETQVALSQDRAALIKALGRLPARERLILRLRFERELTLDEIARLLRLDSPQSADRRIREALETLRRTMRMPARGRLPAAEASPEG